LDLWGSDTESVRIMAFLNIRKLAIHLPYPFIDGCLKGSYLTYVRNAKFINPRTLPVISFMSNCIVELCSLDFPSAYNHAFVYIRQLAIHLRTAYTDKTKEKHQSVYNWQTMNSIMVWVKLLITHTKETTLWMLAYPLIQLIHGIIALVPTPRHYPLRCHAIKMLNELAAACHRAGTEPPFLNSASYILEMLQFPPLLKKPAHYTGKKLDFSHTLSVPQNLLSSKGFGDAIIAEIHTALVGYFACYATSIAFPELVVPAVVALKKFIKNSKAIQYTVSLKSLVDVLQTNATLITAKRNSVTFGPTDKQKAFHFSQSISNSPLVRYKKERDAVEKAKRDALNQQQKDEIMDEETRQIVEPEADQDTGSVDNENDDGEQDIVQDFEFSGEDSE